MNKLLDLLNNQMVKIVLLSSMIGYVISTLALMNVNYLQYGLDLYCQAPHDERVKLRDAVNNNRYGHMIVITCVTDR